MSEEKKSKPGVLQLVMVGLLVVAAFAIGSMWTELRMLKGQGGAMPQGDQVAPGELPEEGITELSEDQWQEVLSNPAFTVGEPEAAVVIVEFTDYQCPFCKRHVDETAGQINENYVEEGKVKYIYRDLPLPFHANAHLASQAARCAGDQDKYLEYRDRLFETQASWSEEEAAGLFKTYAGGLGLDQGQFDSCLDEEKYKQAVDDDLALATKVEATGTPSFFINGKSLVGAQPFAAFEIMIEEALGE